jgi:hypothetical protein
MAISPRSSTIFPGVPNDVDCRIVSFVPPRDQVRVTLVNHRAYELLSNDGHFKTIFEKYSGDPEKRICRDYLSEFYSEKCWKIACYYIEPQGRPIHFSESLLQEPITTQFFPVRIAHIQQQIREICGTRYADPASPIHQAWLAAKDHEKKHEEMCKKYMEQAAALQEILSAHPDLIPQLVSPGNDAYRKNPKEVFTKIDKRLETNYAVELIQITAAAIEKQAKTQPLTAEEEQVLDFFSKNLEDKYLAMEHSRVHLQKTLNWAESSHARLTDPSQGKWVSEIFIEKNQSNLTLLFEIHYLSECLNQMDLVETGSAETVDPHLQRIRTLINSCSIQESTRIWQSLYHWAAGGVQEERWSELHFHEHLKSLGSIVAGIRNSMLNCLRWDYYPVLEKREMRLFASV